MDLLTNLKQLKNTEHFINTSNFYFENHTCEKSGNTIKIRLDYVLSNEITDDILRFGICPDCGICFYHKDFQSKGL